MMTNVFIIIINIYLPNVLLPADENPPPTFDDTAMQNESAVDSLDRKSVV